jgi:hypothetical protein
MKGAMGPVLAVPRDLVHQLQVVMSVPAAALLSFAHSHFYSHGSAPSD